MIDSIWFHSIFSMNKKTICCKKSGEFYVFPTHSINFELIKTFSFVVADGVMNIGVYSDSTEGLDCYWESIYMDDIAMPGSFWLNPPHPKDDEGNGVDVFSVIKSYDDVERKQQQQQKESTQQATNEVLADDINPEDNEGYLSAILMDMDPL